MTPRKNSESEDSRAVRAAVWAVALLVTAVVVPAVTTQWTERPREQEIKSALVNDMTESAAQAINTTRSVGLLALPAAYAARLDCPPRSQPTGIAPQRCADAVRNEQLETAKVTYQTRTAWRIESSSLRARIATYFPGTESAWRAYQINVETFLLLPTTDCDDARTRELLRYLGVDLEKDDAAQKWQPLVQLTPRQCASAAARLNERPLYAARMTDLTVGLNERGQELVDAIRKGDTHGFSTSFRDFWADVDVPFLLVAIFAALAFLVARTRTGATVVEQPSVSATGTSSGDASAGASTERAGEPPGGSSAGT